MRDRILPVKPDARYILASYADPQMVCPNARSLPLFFIRTGCRINLSPHYSLFYATQQTVGKQACIPEWNSTILCFDQTPVKHLQFLGFDDKKIKIWHYRQRPLFYLPMALAGQVHGSETTGSEWKGKSDLKGPFSIQQERYCLG